MLFRSFSIGIPTFVLKDVGPHGFDGRVENMPDRAMTGSNWSGKEHRWTHLPEEWGAIHFHDDDIGDVGWEKAFDIEIPRDWPSGMYCVHLKSAAGIDNVPFFVRPKRGTATSKVGFLASAATYTVYMNNRGRFMSEVTERYQGRLALTVEVIYGHAIKAAPRVPVSPTQTVSLQDMRAMLKPEMK